MSLSCEDDFQAKIMREYIYPHYFNSGTPFEWYTKVYRIENTWTLSEIDLIIVENHKNVVGYEFKFLRQERKSGNYPQIYSGIGQTLLYFWHGIQQGILCIGISKKVSESIMDKIIQLTSIDNLNKLMSPKHRCIGLWVYHEEKGTQRFVNIQPEGRFPVNKIELIERDRKNIIDGKISWKKNFLKKYNLVLNK